MNKHKPEVLALVMAGGEGTRLFPLTADRCKPSVPFNGKHRIVDFVLGNLVNSGIYSVYLLVQYKSQALIEHVRNSWTMTPFIRDHFVTVVPAQMRNGKGWFQGTADAVAQNLHLLDTHQPDLVAVFGADHIYRMDVSQMISEHLRREADVTIATLPVPLEQCSSFGIIETDGDPEWPISAAPDPSESAQIESGSIKRSVVGAGCVPRGYFRRVST
jgi:glucose-1-phosphate adenylyltransferase